MLTLWGYEIQGDTLPDMLSVDDFDAATGNRWAGDARVPAQIAAAQAAIRNYCAWHVSPSLKCVHVADSLPRKRIIQLPAVHVTAVDSVTVDGEEVPFKWNRNGLVRLQARLCADEWQNVEVRYTAGLDSAPAITDLIVHRVTHALAVPAGVQSESAGGVSVTYAASWTSNNRATNLPSDNQIILDPYRVEVV